MSAPLAHNLDTARAHMFAQFREAFPTLRSDDRALRLDLLSRVTGHRIETTGTFTEEQYRWTARRLRQLAECPDSAAELLREAAAATAPTIDTATFTETCRVDLTPADTRDAIEAMLDRIGEVGAELFYALGDAARGLIAAAPPGSLKKDVLGEYLRGHESLKPLLCPDGEGCPVTQWLMLERTSARVPVETRLEFGHVPFGYHKAAALTLMTKNGLRVPPDLAEIERRLSAVSDNETQFRKPADLREWIVAGSRTAPDGSAERPDYTEAALIDFRLLCDTTCAADAWTRLFGPGGKYRVVKARATR